MTHGELVREAARLRSHMIRLTLKLNGHNNISVADYIARYKDYPDHNLRSMIEDMRRSIDQLKLGL